MCRERFLTVDASPQVFAVCERVFPEKGIEGGRVIVSDIQVADPCRQKLLPGPEKGGLQGRGACLMHADMEDKPRHTVFLFQLMVC